MTITSAHNDRLKALRKLRMRRRARERAGRFVAEGEDLLRAADAAGWEPVERYAVAGSGLPGIEVEARALAQGSGLASGTRTLAVYEERWAEAPLGALCVYLHGVHDPGNVGTILRAAHAFGAGSVAFGPGTADPFSPKAVRASMGAVFAVPLARAEPRAGPDGDGHGGPAGARSHLAELPGRTIALVVGEGPALSELSHELPLTLLIGAEREGLPAEVVRAADAVAHIPIRSHSLNAAMAATVALYEVTRMARGG